MDCDVVFVKKIMDEVCEWVFVGKKVFGELVEEELQQVGVFVLVEERCGELDLFDYLEEDEIVKF